MWSVVTSLCLATAYLAQSSVAQSGCDDLSDLSGNITHTYPGPRSNRYSKCWNILNPSNQLLEIELKYLDFQQKKCSYVYLTITANRSGESVKWCDNNKKRELISVYSNVTVYFYVDNNELSVNGRKNFELLYNIDDTINGVEGVEEAKWQAIQWLKSNSSSLERINNIPKAVTALALAGGANLDGLYEELMLKQRDLRVSVSLLRENVSNEQLSTFINSILSTCQNPRNFYGRNLVELLRNQVKSENSTHPASYLALCNADESWPDKAYDDLIGTYNSQSDFPFKRDFQAFAVMALACQIRRNSTSYSQELFRHYNRSIGELKSLQEESGRFGNEHRTALITQALIASDVIDWRLYKAVKYLIKSIHVSRTDFLTYLTLPVLSGKSLVDIGFTNCSSSKDRDSLVDEIHDYLGPKIHVQYSLFVGDAKDVIHTIILRVPTYFKAFDVMQFAALKDKKYRFKHEMVSGKMDIYEMAGIPNDPEDGTFWLFYKKVASSSILKHVTTGPDRMDLREGDNIVMWYKKAQALI